MHAKQRNTLTHTHDISRKRSWSRNKRGFACTECVCVRACVFLYINAYRYTLVLNSFVVVTLDFLWVLVFLSLLVLFWHMFYYFCFPFDFKCFIFLLLSYLTLYLSLTFACSRCDAMCVLLFASHSAKFFVLPFIRSFFYLFEQLKVIYIFITFVSLWLWFFSLLSAIITTTTTTVETAAAAVVVRPSQNGMPIRVDLSFALV